MAAEPATQAVGGAESVSRPSTLEGSKDQSADCAPYLVVAVVQVLDCVGQQQEHLTASRYGSVIVEAYR